MPHTPPPTGNWLNCSIQHDHSMLPYCTASVYRIFCVRLDILCVLFSCVLAPCKATCVENSHHSWIMQVHVPPSASPARGICRVNLSSQIRTLLYRGGLVTNGGRHGNRHYHYTRIPKHRHSRSQCAVRVHQRARPRLNAVLVSAFRSAELYLCHISNATAPWRVCDDVGALGLVRPR